MYIINPEVIDNTYQCNKIIAEYLIKICGVPLLSKKGNIYYFSNSEILKEALDKMPFYIKLFK